MADVQMAFNGIGVLYLDNFDISQTVNWISGPLKLFIFLCLLIIMLDTVQTSKSNTALINDYSSFWHHK